MVDDSQGNGKPRLVERSAFKVLAFALSHTDNREETIYLPEL